MVTQKKERCPTCGAPVNSIFDHVDLDECPKPEEERALDRAMGADADQQEAFVAAMKKALT